MAGSTTAARRSGPEVELRAVRVGSTNEKFIVIGDGLQAGDEVVLNPRSYLPDDKLATGATVPAKRDEQPRQAEATPAGYDAPATVGSTGS